ncbi:hypothetical protein AVEN_5609-1 [Araneus ventricosus]|uniref:Uncharacterized protein n=1 Tax=Araneus ventricosus TaxID=182803 RepID=A0A4Y2MIQ0_ARAVE|nr:hypothetical protein AVEN_5609-1 [Araneus ventricosus]
MVVEAPECDIFTGNLIPGGPREERDIFKGNLIPGGPRAECDIFTGNLIPGGQRGRWLIVMEHPRLCLPREGMFGMSVIMSDAHMPYEFEMDETCSEWSVA